MHTLTSSGYVINGLAKSLYDANKTWTSWGKSGGEWIAKFMQTQTHIHPAENEDPGQIDVCCVIRSLANYQ